MLKFIFWALLALNAVLFAYGGGMLGNAKTVERDAARITSQLNTDKLVLLSAGVADHSPVAPGPVAPIVPAAADGLVACTEIGNFTNADARRFERQLAPLKLDDSQITQAEVQSQEITSYMVMIPPLGSREAADKKAAELKEQGVSNYFILNDATPAKWAISLGVFKSETAAQTLLAALVKQGVAGAKIAGRSTAATRTVYRIRDIDPAAKASLEAIVERFDTLEARNCK